MLRRGFCHASEGEIAAASQVALGDLVLREPPEAARHLLRMQAGCIHQRAGRDAAHLPRIVVPYPQINL